MHIQEREERGRVVLRIVGDMLSETTQQSLREKVRSLATAGSKHVVLDLSGVRYMNSCGLGSLVSAFTTLRTSGGDLRLSGVTGHVRELLDITHLDRVFSLFPTLDSAISSK